MGTTVGCPETSVKTAIFDIPEEGGSHFRSRLPFPFSRTFTDHNFISVTCKTSAAGVTFIVLSVHILFLFRTRGGELIHLRHNVTIWARFGLVSLALVVCFWSGNRGHRLAECDCSYDVICDIKSPRFSFPSESAGRLPDGGDVPIPYFLQLQLRHRYFCVPHDLRTNSEYFTILRGWLVFITEMVSVYCAVRVGSLNKTKSIHSVTNKTH
jgi:hypothetical protein